MPLPFRRLRRPPALPAFVDPPRPAPPDADPRGRVLGLGLSPFPSPLEWDGRGMGPDGAPVELDGGARAAMRRMVEEHFWLGEPRR